jgi:hypothetical protein
MAAVDDWVSVSPTSEKDDWTSVSGNAPTKEFRQPGTKQALSDEAIVAKERGAIPDELKTAMYSAGEMGAFSAPTYVAAKLAQKKDQSFEDALNEQRAYVQALQRQNPKSSMAGSATGLVGSMFVPLGPLGAAGRLAARGAGAMGAGATGKAIASGATIGAGLGAGSGAAEKYGTEEFTPGEIAKSAGIGAVGGGILAPIAERIIGRAVSPADAAKSEILTSQGVTPSKEMITGVRAAEGSPRTTADKMAEEARDILSQKVEGMKTPAVSPNAGAEAVNATRYKSFETGQEPYGKIDQMRGLIDFDFAKQMGGPQTPHEYIMPYVQKSLANSNVNPNYSVLKQNYPNSNLAMDYLNIQLNSFADKAGGPTLAEAMQAKKELGKLYSGAKGEDRAALQAIIDGYKTSINQSVIDGLFVGDKLPAAVELFRADKGWSDYRKTFDPGKGAESSIWNRILKSTSDDRGFVTKELTPEKAQAAQALINANIINPRLGPALYAKLERTIGSGTPEMEGFNALIRNNMLTAKNNEMANLPAQIQKYTEPTALPVTLKAFGANDGKLNTLIPHPSDSAATAAAKERILDTQKLGQAIDIINKRPIADDQKQSMIADAVKKYALPLAGAAFGLPHGTEALLYGMVGKGASDVGSGIGSIRGAAAQRAGAPRSVQPETAGSPIPVGKAKMTPVIQNIPGMVPVQEEPNYGLPQARATGGRVTTSGQLMAAMERAGKKDVQNTKPLLQSTDTAVAKALEIANQHI